MPSDYLDYENNLAFVPKSADDLNEQKRDSEVLVAALEKCEKLEKQLGIAVKKLQIARDLLSSGRPLPYEYALERIKAIDEVRS